MINIKRILLLLFFAGSLLPALHAQEAANVRVQEKIIKYYNNRNYTKLYSMLSPEFKRSMDQDGLEYFMDYEMHERHKQARQATYLRNEQGAHVYLVVFEKGKLEMHLAVNTDGLIETLTFLPNIKLKPGLATETTYPNNNPLSCSIDSICDQAMRKFGSDNHITGLTIGIIKNGSQYVYGYGETYKKSGDIPGPNTIFDIGSISKTFTGLLLATAIEQKLVSPDDDIRRYLEGPYPNLVYEGTPVTLAHLVSHTSALPRMPLNFETQPGYNENDPYVNYTKDMLLADLQKIKLTRKPGSRSEYSNYGSALCGIILENIFHKPYAQLVSEYITSPWAMNATGVNIPDSATGNRVGSYDEEGAVIPDWHLGDMAAAGGISSTLTDMLRYMVMNYEEKTTALKLVHTPVHKEADRQATGYYWVITKLNNGNHLVWHNGATAGSTSFCGYIKETGTAVVVLNNSGTSVDDLAINLLAALK
jgi:CubicO group peptidase (beta-lactamase class C family)